jgi:polysaccharide biosynthesis/export protein
MAGQFNFHQDCDMIKFTSSVMVLALSLSACVTMPTPRNLSQSIYASQQQLRNGSNETPRCSAAIQPPELAGMTQIDASVFAFAPDQLAQGDRLRLNVSGDKDRLTGTYVIAADGTILLDGSVRISAAGRTVQHLEQEIADKLVALRFIRGLPRGVALEQIELTGVTVSVSGAVFEPGSVRVGERQPEMRSVNLSNIVSGDQNISRMVSTALRAAGGLRPDADARMVYLARGERFARIDMSGALEGTLHNDLPVTAGDRIIVASVGCLQEKMVRPSPVTAPGIRIFMSNLSRPASHNAASAIGKETTSLPYGTRFLQGLVAANCVGGSAMNAGRSAVLISRNPINGKSIVISRSVEKMVRDADRDQFDPYLMPGDSIACYDSLAMNLRDVLSVAGETTAPYLLFRKAN